MPPLTGIFLPVNLPSSPDEHTELWMRVLIVLLLLAFGLYADIQTRRLLMKEEEKRRIFKATISSTQHILNNLLNNLMFFKLEMEESDVFSDEIKRLFDETLKKGTIQVQRLSEVEDLSEENIKQSVYPQ